MLSHVPVLKETFLLIFSDMYGRFSCLSVWGTSASLSPWSVQEHNVRGQCISSCYSLSLPHKGSQEWRYGNSHDNDFLMLNLVQTIASDQKEHFRECLPTTELQAEKIRALHCTESVLRRSTIVPLLHCPAGLHSHCPRQIMLWHGTEYLV